MKSRAIQSRGFSLVEVVLAIGIIGFAITAIFGLLSAGLNSSKSSLDKNLVALMSRQIIGNLRQQQFIDNPLFANVTNGVETVIQTAYFDVNGARLFASDGVSDIGHEEALQQKAVYQCTVTAKGVTQTAGDPQGLGPAPATSGAPCMVDLHLTFSWPIEAKTPNAFSLRAALAKYD